MSKLVLTAIYGSDMSQTGKVLIDDRCLHGQLNKIATKNEYVQVAPEDLSLITKLFSVDIDLFSRENEILYSMLRKKSVNKKSVNDSLLNILHNNLGNGKSGNYELCLHLLTIVDRDRNTRFIGIQGCSMRYHFSDDINFNEIKINKLGFYKGNVSHHGRYCRERPWMYACLFQLQNRGDLFNESIIIDDFLAKCVNLSWTLFFSDQVKDSKRPRNYFWKTEYRYSLK